MQNSYKGMRALQNFHNPNNHVTPLVELPEELNPYYHSGVHIYAKLLYMMPLLNVKSIPAWHMMQDVLSKRNDIDHFVESSSGNTAYSISVYGRVYNNSNTTAIVSTEVTQGKKNILKLIGLDLQYHEEPICPDPGNPNSGINLAKKIGKNKGWCNLGQYDNALNWESHYNIAAPQMYAQLPEIDVLVTSLGTTGTLLGLSQYLKSKNSNLITLGTVRKENNPIPGPRTEGLLSHIAFDWRSHVDEVVKVSSYSAYEKSKLLCQYGILGGPSSGMQYYAALEYAKTYVESEKDLHIVFTCPDTALPYVDEYDNFLLEKEEGYTVEHLLDDMQNNENIYIVDLRTKDQFDEYHIDLSESVPFHFVDQFVETFLNKKKKYVFLCSFGSKSEIISQHVKSLGYNAVSLVGGMLSRYNNGHPVCKNSQCVRHR